jgi:hypothetical protein
VYTSRRTSRVWYVLRLAAVLNVMWVSIGESVVASATTPGSQLWVKDYNGPGNLEDHPQSIDVSPDGTKVFVAGYSQVSSSQRDYATVAYEASTGAKLWATRYNGPGNETDEATALEVSPDGSTVFVTGFSLDVTTRADFATIAYDTSTGAELWVKRFNGPRNRADGASALGVTPDGSTVFVTGFSRRTNNDYLTIAYEATVGSTLWVNRYNGPGRSTDQANAIGVSPDGSAVFVTGFSWGTTTVDYATIAYDASTGSELWVKRHSGPGNSSNVADALDMSPDGSTVFVTGTGPPKATVAYDASSGAKLWARAYDGRAGDLGVSPDGSMVFVTGTSIGTTTYEDYRTVSYDALSGETLWADRYNGPANANDDATALGVSPDGATVFVTGSSWGTTTYVDYATAAYDTSAGAKLWVRRYSSPGSGAASTDFAEALAVGQDGSAVFVTGASTGTTTREDYATVAYGT